MIMAVKRCINLGNIDDALDCSNIDNMGGIVPSLIYGYWDDVATWPDLPVPTAEKALELDEAGAWSGDVVMKEGTCAYKMDFTDDTGEFKMSDQGETGGESTLYDLTIIAAKMRKKIFGFQNATKGKKMFFIVQDNNGIYYLMGDRRNGAKSVAGDGATTGANATARNQTSLKFQYNCPRKLVYEGDTENLLKVTPAPSPGG